MATAPCGGSFQLHVTAHMRRFGVVPSGECQRSSAGTDEVHWGHAANLSIPPEARRLHDGSFQPASLGGRARAPGLPPAKSRRVHLPFRSTWLEATDSQEQGSEAGVIGERTPALLMTGSPQSGLDLTSQGWPPMHCLCCGDGFPL